MSRAAEAYKEKKRIRELLSAKKNGTITANAKKIEEKLQIGSEELPVKANERFNFSAPLHFAITRSKYFKTLENIITFEDLVEEIINNVDHGNLYQNASRTEPSKLACLIHKLFVSNITIENAKFLLNQYDSPYIRLAGVLYLRLGLDYGDLWDWLEPVLADYDLLYVDFEKQKQIKLGEIIEEILTSNLYNSMHLPRIPMDQMKKFASIISGADGKENYDAVRDRAKRNEPIRHLHIVGSRVDARFSKDNLFYSAIIKEISDYDQFLISYDHSNIVEKRGLGFIELRRSGYGDDDNDGGRRGGKDRREEFDFNKRKGNGNYNNDYEERDPKRYRRE